MSIINKSTILSSFFFLSFFGYPLVSGMTTLLNIENRPVSITLKIVVFFLSVFFLLPIKISVFRNKYFILFFSFWVFYSLRIISTLVNEEKIIPFMSNVNFYAFSFGTCLIPSLAIFNGLHKKTLNTALMFNITFYLLLVTAALNIYLSIKLGLSEGVVTGRLSTSTLNPITLGHLGASLTLLSIFPLFIKRKIITVSKYFLLIGIAIGILSVISAASKGPIIALLIALLCLIFIKIEFRKVFHFIFIGLVFVGFSIITIHFFENNFNTSAFQRFDGLINLLIGTGEADLSTSIRMTLIADSWNQFLSSPLTGSGIVEKNMGFYPHNLVVESFMSTGIIGGSIFILLSFLMFKISITIIKNDYPLAWAGLLSIQYLIASLFSGSLFASNTFWLSMAFTFSIYIYYSKYQQSTLKY